MLVAVGNGVFSNTATDPVWSGLYVNGQPTQNQNEAKQSQPIFNKFKNASAPVVLQGLRDREIIEGNAVWNALGQTNADAIVLALAIYKITNNDPCQNSSACNPIKPENLIPDTKNGKPETDSDNSRPENRNPTEEAPSPHPLLSISYEFKEYTNSNEFKNNESLGLYLAGMAEIYNDIYRTSQYENEKARDREKLDSVIESAKDVITLINTSKTLSDVISKIADGTLHKEGGKLFDEIRQEIIKLKTRGNADDILDLIASMEKEATKAIGKSILNKIKDGISDLAKESLLDTADSFRDFGKWAYSSDSDLIKYYEKEIEEVSSANGKIVFNVKAPKLILQEEAVKGITFKELKDALSKFKQKIEDHEHSKSGLNSNWGDLYGRLAIQLIEGWKKANKDELPHTKIFGGYRIPNGEFIRP